MIYITIPVHNEECTIGVLLWKIRKVMAAFGRDYRILVLDDASTDATAEVLERYASLLPLEVDRVSERIGQGAATARLLERAVGASDYPKRDIAVTIQADFTEDPVVIEPLVKAIEGGADLVAGALDPLSLTRQRRTGRWLAGMLLGKAGRDAPVSDPFSSLRAYRLVVVRKALREGSEAAELLSSDGWAANLELLAATVPHARRVEETPYRMRERPHGRESRFNLWAELKRLVPLRRLRWKTLAMVLALFWAMSPGSAGLGAAQAERPTGAVTVAAPVPFGPGERAEYQVRLGRVSVGEGHLEVRALETVRGYRTYHVTMGISGGVPLARVNNHYQSWIDVSSLSSRRFIQSQHEVRYRRFRHFEFFPEERRWSRADVEESGELETDSPLDDLSFLFYARTLPLVVGESYTLDRYFRPDGNPVVIQVVRRDRVEVPAGTFNTIVVRPVIQTRGLFAEGGEAEIHFSDDERRVMVQLRSRVPVVGSLTLSLRSLTPGRPIHDS